MINSAAIRNLFTLPFLIWAILFILLSPRGHCLVRLDRQQRDFYVSEYQPHCSLGIFKILGTVHCSWP